MKLPLLLKFYTNSKNKTTYLIIGRSRRRRRPPRAPGERLCRLMCNVWRFRQPWTKSEVKASRRDAIIRFYAGFVIRIPKYSVLFNMLLKNKLYRSVYVELCYNFLRVDSSTKKQLILCSYSLSSLCIARSFSLFLSLFFAHSLPFLSGARGKIQCWLF